MLCIINDICFFTKYLYLSHREANVKAKLLFLSFNLCILMIGACAGLKALVKNNCCQKTLEIDYGDQDLIGPPDYQLARNDSSRADSSPAKLLLTIQRDWLIPCNYHAVVIIEHDFSCTKNVFRPAAPALNIDQLEKIAEINLTIAETNPNGFESFIILLMRNPPDQAQFVRYLGSQELRADSNNLDIQPPATPLYCRHNFALYRLKTPLNPEELRRFTKK